MSLGLPAFVSPQAQPFQAVQRFGLSTLGAGWNTGSQQALLVQMMMLTQMLFRQVLGAGGASFPTAANFGGQQVDSGLGSFLGSGLGSQRGAAPSLSSSTEASAPTADLSTVKGTEFGKKFAQQAEKTARRINTPGLCLKGVNDTMEAMGIPVQREAAAYMALDNFRSNKRFREVKASKDQLKSLPAGAVVIWDKGPGLPYGHISVALGNGREASSTVRNQLQLRTNYHVFLPRE